VLLNQPIIFAKPWFEVVDGFFQLCDFGFDAALEFTFLLVARNRQKNNSK